jgi:hypothetical protein
VNDIVTQIDEPDQTVVVHVDEEVVALLVYFQDPCKPLEEPDEVVFLSAVGAERLGFALVHAAVQARETS